MFHKILTVSIVFLLLFSCSPKVDKQKFDNLYRAAKAIEGAVSVGVSYKKYSELLQNLATEISLGSDKAKTDIEKELLKSFLEVLTTHKECAFVWGKKIEFVGHGWPKVQIPISLVRPLITKYDLSTEKIYLGEVVSTDKAMQRIWAKAHQDLEKASKIYHGQ